jgi:tRNA(fMet)-specific endonuclease VapC
VALIIADTDVLIDALNGRPDVTPLIEDLLGARRLATMAITRLELGVGAGTPERWNRVRTLLSALPILPLDADSAGLAARIGATLQDRGQPLPMADLAIGGICLHFDAALLTRNHRHFGRIEGLRLAELPQA